MPSWCRWSINMRVSSGEPSLGVGALVGLGLGLGSPGASVVVDCAGGTGDLARRFARLARSSVAGGRS